MSRDSQNDDRANRPAPGLHARLQRAAGLFAYPPTPEIAARERQRVARLRSQQNGKQRRPAAHAVLLRVAWALTAVALITSLVLVSPARARVIEWLRVGAVRIFLEASPAPPDIPPPAALTGLAGEISLAGAAQQVPFALRVPAYPPGLDEPQHIYLQQRNGTPLVIMVWLQPDDPQAVRLALYQIGEGEGDVFQKRLIQNMRETTVNGQWALWVEGPYLLTTTGGQVEERRVVSGRTLIWNENGLTYRLETDLPLEEARKIAESLRAWP